MRGHFHYGEGGWPGPEPLPGPGELVDLDRITGAGEGPPGAGVWRGGPAAPDGPATPPGDSGADPPPAPLRPTSSSRSSSSSSSPKITATVRRDISAKLSLPLEVLGQIWAVRDPICGGRFLEQRPAVADAFTDVICQSADLVDFFTGPAGGYMAYFKVGAALWPVAEVWMAHHVTHSIGQPRDQAPAPGPDDLSRYVA